MLPVARQERCDFVGFRAKPIGVAEEGETIRCLEDPLAEAGLEEHGGLAVGAHAARIDATKVVVSSAPE